MKVLELILDDTELAGVQAISLVKNPAIEANWVYFNQSTPYTLAAVDEEKRMLIGPALIPEKRILRVDPNTMEPYEVFFSAETIRQVAEKYMAQARQEAATYEHQVEIDGVLTVESWIVEDPERDKSKVFGFNMVEGTWMVGVKVFNDTMWDRVKKKEVQGFSIEGYFADQLISAHRVNPCPGCPTDPEELEELENVVLSHTDPVFELNGVPYFRTEGEADLYAMVFFKSQGTEAVDVSGVTLYRPVQNSKETPTNP